MIMALLAKSTLVALAALLAVALSRRARASVRHAILAAMFSVLAILPIAPLAMPRIDLPLLPAAGPSLIFGAAATDAADEHLSAPVASAPESLATAPAEVDQRSARADRSPRLRPSQLVAAAWLTGAAVALLSLLVGVYRVQQLRRTALPSLETQRHLCALAESAGAHAAVEVVTHERVNAPITCGVWRMSIVMPADAHEWSGDAVERALLHELEHVKRRDWAVQILARTVCALYWFHPLVWWAYRQLCLQAEHACDDAVVARTEDTTYAAQLVMLARRMAAPPAGAAVLGMAHRSDLATRVAAVLDVTRARGPAGAVRATSIAMAAVALLLAIGPLQLVAAPRTELPTAKTVAPDTPVPLFTAPPASPRVSDNAPAQQRPASNGEAARRMQVSSRLSERRLVEAAGDGEIRAVTELLDAGANVNAAVIGDGSPLIAAAREGHDDIVRLLLDRGADVNLAVEGDGAPLIMAAREGHLGIVQILLDRGADIEQMVRGDENALMQASAEGQLDVVTLLVARGANVHARTWIEQVFGRDGGEWRSPLSMALRGGHRRVADVLINAGAVQ